MRSLNFAEAKNVLTSVSSIFTIRGQVKKLNNKETKLPPSLTNLPGKEIRREKKKEMEKER